MKINPCVGCTEQAPSMRVGVDMVILRRLEDNTTWDLVADYEKIREKLGIER